MSKTNYKPIKEKVKVEPEEKRGYVRDFITGRWLKNKPEEGPRQILEKRLVEEYGYSKSQIEIEFPVQKGSKRIGPTDIAVFRNEKKVIDNLYIIVEIKRKERKDGIDQLKSYLSPTNAEFGVWFNGKDIVYLQHLKKAPFFREIPDIPKEGETLEDVGLYQKKDLKPATELKTVFETIHNHIYANEGLLKEKVFNEMLKLIFIKMADEKALAQKCEFRITDKELEELEEGKENGFMERILNLFERVKSQYPDVFDPNERLNLKPLTIAFVVSQLQKYSLINTAADVKGTAFQTFVYAHQRGERGEFFTPHSVVDLCVNMIDPRDNEKFIDPACGSGGFLVAGMNYIKEKFIKERPELKGKSIDFLKEYAHAYISGIDINPDLAKVAKMHMVLYDDGHSGIFCANSLLPFDELIRLAEKAGVSRALRPQPGNFRVLMTNPPFGSKGKVTDKRILQNFELGYKWKQEKDGRWIKINKILDGQTPEILFIERSLSFLDKEGRMAIVLPDSILTSPTNGYVRELIKKESIILGTVGLPEGTFTSAGAGSKTSVLFLRKKINQQEKQGKVFMAIAENIGYDISSKRGKIIAENDLPIIAEKFLELQSAGDVKFSKNPIIFVISDIGERLDPSFYYQQFIEIPGRKILPLWKAVDLVGGKMNPKNFPEKEFYYIEIGDVNVKTGMIEKPYQKLLGKKVPSGPKYVVKEGDILVSLVRPTRGAIAIVPKDLDEALATGGFAVLRAKGQVSKEYIYAILRMPFALNQMGARVGGGTYPTIKIEDVKEVKIPIPSPETEKKIISEIKELLKLQENEEQVRRNILNTLEDL